MKYVRGHVHKYVIVASLCLNVWLACAVFAGDIDHVQDRVCVPLYDQTGLECCQ